MGKWDKRGVGKWDFSEEDYDRTLRAINVHCRGKANVMQTEKFAALEEIAGLGPRTLRAIMSVMDGVEFVLAQGDKGFYVAEFEEETREGTGRLLSQASKMAERAERRRSYAEENLPRRQPKLFAESGSP